MLETYIKILKATEDQFIREIASVRKEGITVDWLPWGFFRLGMYKSVVSLEVDCFDLPRNINGFMPFVVSLAAIGRHEEARHILNNVNLDLLPDALRISIVRNISAFMPQEALNLMRTISIDINPLVSILTYIRSGSIDLATDALEINSKNNQFFEFELYELSMRRIDPEHQLRLVNRLLSNDKVSEVGLINSDLNLNSSNVICRCDQRVFNGPLVSVLMTAYNSSERIKTAIHSILGQSYYNIELIVVDDFSSDDTCKIIEEIAKKDSRVSLLKLDFNVGTYLAKSIGLKFASGEFITCMDTDDWSHPQKLEIQARDLINNPDRIANISSCIRMYDNGMMDVSGYQKPVRINHSSLMFRKDEVLSATGAWCWFVRECADSEIISRFKLVFGDHRIKRIDAVLSIVSRHGRSLTSVRRFNSKAEYQSLPESWVDFTEAYMDWYVRCVKDDIVPMMNFDFIKSYYSLPFNAPGQISVELDAIRSLGSFRP